MNHKSVFTFFSQGRFKDLGQIFDELGAREASRSKERTLLVGALVILGRFEEATQLFDLFKHNSTSEEKITCLMYMGMANVRRSQYTEAKKSFLESIRELRKQKKSHSESWLRSAFYAWFGIAFFRHFQARWDKGIIQAEKALGYSKQADFSFGALLAHDLLAHLYFNEGKVHESLKSFKSSQTLAKKLQNDSILKSSQIAEAIYRCHVLQVPGNEKPEDYLSKSIDLLHSDDSYSRANLILELSRHLMMAGKMSKAAEALNDAYDAIFSYRHRRQTSEINLRFSYNLWWQGQAREALSLLRSSEANLDLQIDCVQILQVHGLQRSIWSSINKEKPITELEKNLHKENRQNFINRRIENRLSQDSTFVFNQGEDLLGDLINGLKAKSEKALETCLEYERFGLLSHFYEAKPGELVLVCDRKKSLSISLCKGDVSVKKIKWSENLLKLVKALSQGICTKESLVEKCFGYSYDPERHDPLLYASLSRLRKAFGDNQSILEIHEGGYQFISNLKILFIPNFETVKRIVNTDSPTNSISPIIANQFKDIELEINSRQLTLLRTFAQSPKLFIGAREYSEIHQISLATAFRDLEGLIEKKLIKRLGKARATRYQLNAHFSLLKAGDK